MKHLKRINENFLQKHEGLDDILVELSDIIKPLVDPRPINNDDPDQTGSGTYDMRKKYSHYKVLYNIPSKWRIDDVTKFYNTFKTIIRRIEGWCSSNNVIFHYNCSNGLSLYFTIENH
jgi:hypothetical protein